MKKRKSLDFSHSMNDLMASLAAVFLILIAGLIIAKKNDDAKKSGKIQEAKSVIYNDIVIELGLTTVRRGQIAQKDCIKVDASAPDRVKISFFTQYESTGSACEGLTFGEGDFVLGSRSVEMIKTKLTNIFSKVCSSKWFDLINQISVVGHSDVTPQPNRGQFSGCGASEKSTNERFCNNYSLSAKRAESVYFVLRNSLMRANFATTDKVVECVDQKFVTQGRGPTHPNSDVVRERKWMGEDTDYITFTKEEKAKDRRVEIEIVLIEPRGE